MKLKDAFRVVKNLACTFIASVKLKDAFRVVKNLNAVLMVKFSRNL